MLGNLGNKDRRGRQVRLGHHGRNLRVSRTGGVSLRHAVRVGRVGLAVNSRHGVRLSSALGRGTQVATQNGRFILRGRYGKGPVKFNLSKSGVSASLASDVGRLNLTHPGRSSAKLFGVQMRGRKAASINSFVLLASALVAVIQMAAMMLVMTAKAVIWLVAFSIEGVQQLLARWQDARADRAFQARHAALKGFTQSLDPSLLPDDASRLRLLGQVLLTDGIADVSQLKSRLDALAPQLRSRRQATALQSLAEPIALGSETSDNMDEDRRQTWCLLAAQQLFEGASEEAILERFLALDDLCLVLGDKTEAQEDLLALIAETGGLRLTALEAGGGMDLNAAKPKTPSSARLVEPFLRTAQLWP
ncbi:MAG: hypothetical protein ACXIUM_11765 [Wenzhouxiangella sp.]